MGAPIITDENLEKYKELLKRYNDLNNNKFSEEKIIKKFAIKTLFIMAFICLSSLTFRAMDAVLLNVLIISFSLEFANIAQVIGRERKIQKILSKEFPTIETDISYNLLEDAIDLYFKFKALSTPIEKEYVSEKEHEVEEEIDVPSIFNELANGTEEYDVPVLKLTKDDKHDSKRYN